MTNSWILRAFSVGLLIVQLSWQCHGVISVPKFVKLLPNSPSLTQKEPLLKRFEHIPASERQNRFAGIKETGKEFVEKWKNRVQNNGVHLLRGSKSFGLQLKKAVELKAYQVQNGKHSISYEEFHYIEQASADLGKAVRKLGWAPFGRRYVFMSTVVFPLFSSNHLATFKDFPTTFLSTKDQKAREDILIKRRMQAAMHGLYTLQEGQTLDDVVRNEAHAQHTKIVESALQQRNLSQALEVLDPLIVKPEHSVRRTPAVGVAALPSTLVKQCLQALGAASVPNFPILRLLNTLSLKNRVNGIQRSDEFLEVKGVSTLSTEEVKLACFERCIRTENRSEDELRSDLSEWLQLVHPAPESHASAPEAVAVGRPLNVTSLPINGTAVPAPSIHPLTTSGLSQAPNSTAPPVTTSTNTASDSGLLLSQDPPSSSMSTQKSFMLNMRETWDKSVKAVNGFRDATHKAAVVATNAQNKRFALLALHTLRNLRSSSFGGVYRAALSNDKNNCANTTVTSK